MEWNESPERGQGTPEDPGVVLGTALPRAGIAVRDGLHVPEGPEEGRSDGPHVSIDEEGLARVFDGLIVGLEIIADPQRILAFQVSALD